MKSFIICLAATCITIASLAQKANQNQTVVNADGSKLIVYSCSMHPQYISFAAATCPVCGKNMSKKEVMKTEVVMLYTCSMDSVVSTQPGKCPKCSMDMVEYKPKKQQ